MKLSELSIVPIWDTDKRLYKGGILPFEVIDSIIYNGICDDKENASCAIVFGISRKIEMEARVQTAVDLYKSGRIKKMLFTGGKNGISSNKKNQTPKEIDDLSKDISFIVSDDIEEAIRMKTMALEYGIPEEAILVDIISNNTIDTLKSVPVNLNLKDDDSLILVTSGYHMRRCLAGCTKYISSTIHYSLVIAETGYFEQDNYTNTELGIQLANFDAYHIVKQARDGVISDLEI